MVKFIHKSFYIRFIMVFIYSISSLDIKAQIFEFEQSPPSVKWRQINMPKYKLIYPTEIEEDAQYVAALLNKYMQPIGLSIRTNPRKIPIILRNQSVVSNGFVQLSPRRSEFFITAPQKSDPINWLESLTVHEYRHVVQMDKLTPKPPFELLGLAFFGLSLPPWYFEGDAVGIETELTVAGRGRLPSWEMPLRANLLRQKKFSYQKNFFGSMKDVTSGHYQLGYFMTTKIKRDFSNDLLDSVLNRMSKVPIRPYNFSNSLKKFTGKNTRQWYEETMNELHEKWARQVEQNKPEYYGLLGSADTLRRVDYFTPQRTDDKHIIVLSKTLEDTDRILVMDSLGDQQEVVKIGRQSYPNFSYSNGKITWDEVRYDKRFHKQDYNIVNVYDLQRKKYKQLSHKSRLFSPSLNKDASRIVAVEISLNNEEYIVILDSSSGEKIQKVKVPHRMHIQTPSFDQTDTKVIAVGINDEGANLIEFDLSDSTHAILLNERSQQFEKPIYAEDAIIFNAFYSGIDNLYRLDRKSKEVFQLTNAQFGAFNASYDSLSKRILFNNYQANGFQISELGIHDILPRNIDSVQNTFISYFKPLVSEGNEVLIPDVDKWPVLESKPYKELPNLLNFHSLSIGTDDFESMDDVKLGLLLLSDNLLNTLSIRVGAAYNQKIHRPEFSTRITYQRFFPKFNLHYENAGQLVATKVNSEEVIPVRFRENRVKFDIEVPLFFNRLNHLYQLGFKVGSSYTQRYKLSVPELQDNFITKLNFPLEYQLYFTRNERLSIRDLAPKWGQNVYLFYKHSPFEVNLTGNAFSLRSIFYFPGLLSNHSIRARFNYQQHSGSFQFSNYIPMVNGYDQLKPSLPRNTFLLDYRFPIAYPDWDVGPLAYIRRVKAGFFTHFEDFAYHQKYKPKTLGAELRADMNLLRFFLPVFDVGLTAVYINEPVKKKWLFQFGLSYTY